MARPKYETEKDLSNERLVANALENIGVEVYKLPVQYRLDWLLRRDGQPIGFAEVKARTCLMKQYPTVMISLSKVLHARMLSEATGLPAYLVLLYRDGLARLNFNEPFTVNPGGRADRNDPQDLDVCAYYSIDRLKVISHKT
jgi:hypothetical protein